jgi:hypothetical protein
MKVTLMKSGIPDFPRFGCDGRYATLKDKGLSGESYRLHAIAATSLRLKSMPRRRTM